jgi:16S rRNA (cytosine1402-N4)-methyltransferase
VDHYQHRSVMPGEVLAALRPKPGGRYADGTLGGGGHAAALLQASAPDGWLCGSDRDAAALAAAGERLAEFTGRLELRQANFAELADWIPAGSCDGVLLDLGLSSPQLDQAGRGFSFQNDGPLDMRMDPSQGRTAADWVNFEAPETLANIFWEFGDERDARRIARTIESERTVRRIATTTQLAALVERLNPRRGQRTHPATRVFQALRIAVNDELGALRSGLVAALTVLKPGGRLAVITFHSLEDRMVKVFGNERARDYTFDGEVDVPELRRPQRPELRWVSRKAIRPGAAELAENPRSRSAQLRVLEKN